MSNGRILMVTDDKELGNFLRIYFGHHNYKIRWALNLVDTLTIFDEGFMPDCMIIVKKVTEFLNQENIEQIFRFIQWNQLFLMWDYEEYEQQWWTKGLYENLEFAWGGNITIPFDLEELKLRVDMIISRVRRQ